MSHPRAPRRRSGAHATPRWVGVAGLLTALTAASVVLSPLAARATDPPVGPNILVFVTDDQRPDTMEAMPLTRSWFGDGGTAFTHGYVTTPLCCPSRSTIFTGRYVHNHGVLGNASPDLLAQLDQTSTMEAALQGAGYTTGLVGKYLNAWPTQTDPPPYFDRYAMNVNFPYWGPTLNIDGVVTDTTGYATDTLSDESIGLLNDFESDDARPWFLYVAPFAPHAPSTPASRHLDAPVSDWSGNPGVDEVDRTDKPPVVQQQGDNGFTKANAQRTDMLRSLMSVDEMVDRVMTHLDELGEQDTLALFFSDNGVQWAEHGMLGKRLPYLQSVGVPFFMRWPGHVAEGAVDDRLVANIDVKPTVLDAAGIASPTSMDGISMLSSTARDRLPVEYFRSPDNLNYPSWAATLTADHEYVEWYDDDLQTITFREYYDLNADPWQNENLLADADTGNDPDPALVDSMSEALAVDRACVESACVDPPSADTSPPQPPTSLDATGDGSGVDLTWTAASDDVGVVEYRIRRDGVLLATVGPITSWTDDSVQEYTTYTYTVVAFDRAGNAAVSPDASITTPQALWFQDSFETGTMGAWTLSRQVGTDATDAGAGSWSAEAFSTGSGAFARKTLPAPAYEAYLRTWVKVTAQSSGGLGILRAMSPGSGAGIARLVLRSGGRLSVRSEAAKAWLKSSGTMSTGSWHEIEMHLIVGGDSSLVEVWLDGSLVLSRNTSLGSAPVGKIQIGESAGGKVFDTNFDDVAVGPEFI